VTAEEIVMSDTAKVPKTAWTPDQKAEAKPIRESHRQNPIRDVPPDTLRGRDAARLLQFVACVRREREAQGLTVEQLAERAGIDAGVLSCFESGSAFNPTVSTLFRIAGALGRDLVLELNRMGSEPTKESGPC
jgi:ribosome-binding protein aMBF1 (putative translation factor)